MFREMFKENTKIVKEYNIKKENIITEDDNISKAEELLIKNNIKIKNKFQTKFGTEFLLFKEYPKSEIEKILKDIKIQIKDKSIFIFN